MKVACSLCSSEQPIAEAEWNGWKCERCGEVVRGCRECTRKQGQMVARVVLDDRHRKVCPPTGQSVRQPDRM